MEESSKLPRPTVEEYEISFEAGEDDPFVRKIVSFISYYLR